MNLVLVEPTENSVELELTENGVQVESTDTFVDVELVDVETAYYWLSPAQVLAEHAVQEGRAMLATSLEFCPYCTTHGCESPLFGPIGKPGKPSSKHCPTCRAAWRWIGRRWVLMRGSRWAYSDLAQERKRRAIIEAVRSEWADELADCASE